MQLKFKKIHPKAILPQYANPGDVGLDLFCLEDKELQPGKKHLFKTGLAAEIPEGYGVFFKPKSGLAVKRGVDILAGVIDTGYRGEWQVLVVNLGQEPYQFKKGDKIAQAVLIKTDKPEVVEVKELTQTARGQGAFGSTGK